MTYSATWQPGQILKAADLDGAFSAVEADIAAVAGTVASANQAASNASTAAGNASNAAAAAQATANQALYKAQSNAGTSSSGGPHLPAFNLSAWSQITASGAGAPAVANAQMVGNTLVLSENTKVGPAGTSSDSRYASLFALTRAVGKTDEITCCVAVDTLGVALNGGQNGGCSRSPAVRALLDGLRERNAH